jgi:hypothetical protein
VDSKNVHIFRKKNCEFCVLICVTPKYVQDRHQRVFFVRNMRNMETELLYDWQFTANQFVLAHSPLRLTARIYFSQLNTCGHSPYITSSLTRGWVCHLQLLLALASAFILGSESRGTRDHILLSQIRDFPFCRLLGLAGLRWRYSTPPPHGKTWSILHI